MHQNKKHIPVLLSEVLLNLDPKLGDKYLDLTAGYGGHAKQVIEIIGKDSQVCLVDRDPSAVDYLKVIFKNQNVDIRNQDFYKSAVELSESGQKFDLILADLGVSSPHLNEQLRGFSIDKEGPLDMRMDQNQTLDAEKIVNGYSEKQLAKILQEYGEEPKYLRIARLIVRNRPITTTTELAKIVSKAWPGHSKSHPATRTFQAIRIAVNDELNLIEKAIPIWIDLLSPGGRLAIISFHSLEDRIVKQALAEKSGNKLDSELHLLTKKPIVATKDELVFNPRARSAKLRVAAKINKQKKGEYNANTGKKSLPHL
jgi:16S rRNA (cytosine1402-N4)-methyltransferase